MLVRSRIASSQSASTIASLRYSRHPSDVLVSRRGESPLCVHLRADAHVAVIGAGPSGLVAAKHALEAGFEVTVFEASDDLGGQWHAAAAHSGVWPGMHTNTSRAMTAFSDFPAPPTIRCTRQRRRSMRTCTTTRSGSA